MSKFKKGDAVIITRFKGGPNIGSLGFIEFSSDLLYAGVYFPKFEHGHNLSGWCEEEYIGHCWWVKWSDLEIYEEEN